MEKEWQSWESLSMEIPSSINPFHYWILQLSRNFISCSPCRAWRNHYTKFFGIWYFLLLYVYCTHEIKFLDLIKSATHYLHGIALIILHSIKYKHLYNYAYYKTRLCAFGQLREMIICPSWVVMLLYGFETFKLLITICRHVSRYASGKVLQKEITIWTKPYANLTHRAKDIKNLKQRFSMGGNSEKNSFIT